MTFTLMSLLRLLCLQPEHGESGRKWMDGMIIIFQLVLSFTFKD